MRCKDGLAAAAIFNTCVSLGSAVEYGRRSAQVKDLGGEPAQKIVVREAPNLSKSSQFQVSEWTQN